MTARPVIWVHADSLSARNPAFVAYPDAPAIFVFDDVVLEGYRVSLKRILFIYECLLEMPVVIQRGDVAECVIAFARQHSATGVATVGTPSPRFRLLAEQIGNEIPVEVLRERPMIADSRSFALARFSRFWKRAERAAFLLGKEPNPVPASNLQLPGLE